MPRIAALNPADAPSQYRAAGRSIPLQNFWKQFLGLLVALVLFSPTLSMAGGPRNNIIGASGYDLTTYFSQEKPQRGNGHHVAEHDGVTYVFATNENKKTFQANPGKFLPQYGGFCAYGVSVSKKFVADPEQFDIVDGKLYLNLDSKVRAIWLKDMPGRIQQGDTNWTKIVNTSASAL